MILSNECWLKDRCFKYNQGNNKEVCDSESFCMKLFKLDALYNMSLLSFEQRKHQDLFLDESRIDEDSFILLKDIQNNIENFVVNGSNLYIYSSITGNGKTAWAIRLLQSYFNKIWYKTELECKGLFLSVPRYLLAIKDNIGSFNEYAVFVKDNILNADIVIWDDIGTKAATSFEHENLLSIIDNRMCYNKCNIFTSNVSPEDLKVLAGDRLYSRIINYSTCIKFNGCDKRGVIVK